MKSFFNLVGALLIGVVIYCVMASIACTPGPSGGFYPGCMNSFHPYLWAFSLGLPTAIWAFVLADSL